MKRSIMSITRWADLNKEEKHTIVISGVIIVFVLCLALLDKAYLKLPRYMQLVAGLLPLLYGLYRLNKCFDITIDFDKLPKDEDEDDEESEDSENWGKNENDKKE